MGMMSKFVSSLTSLFSASKGVSPFLIKPEGSASGSGRYYVKSTYAGQGAVNS